MPKQKAEVLISVPNVAEGNPSTALALYLHLLQAQKNPSLLLGHLLAIPAALYHRRMTRSAEKSAAYIESGHQTRQSMMPVLGAIAETELAIRGLGHRYDSLVQVQEHPLGLFSEKRLKRTFPRSRFLVIPDVEPKDTAIAVMEKTKITPAVWNTQAANKLDSLGLNPILVSPNLPNDITLPDGTTLEDRVVVKASGSGMPAKYTENLKTALSKIGVPFEIYLPNEIISESGSRSRLRTTLGKVREFYANLYFRTPKVLISYPSEMVQVATILTQLGTNFLYFNPRGKHELVNYNFARKHDLGQAINLIDPETTIDQIKEALQNRPQVTNPQQIGIGMSPLSNSL
jgi:hypothetical protein